jgi:hypothetical protein
MYIRRHEAEKLSGKLVQSVRREEDSTEVQDEMVVSKHMLTSRS